MLPLDQITADLALIGPREIERCTQVLGEPQEGETALLIVESQRHRSLWALAHDYDRRARLVAHAAMFDVGDPQERQNLHQQAMWFTGLEEITRNVAWLELREAVPEGKGWGCTVGLRKGWVLVATKDDDGPGVHLGTVALPAAIGAVLGKLLMGLSAGLTEPPIEEEEAPKPRKPRRKPQ